MKALTQMLVLEVTGCNLKHTLREGNNVADETARIRVNQQDRMVSFVTPPDEVKDLLAGDFAGVSNAGSSLFSSVPHCDVD